MRNVACFCLAVALTLAPLPSVAFELEHLSLKWLPNGGAKIEMAGGWPSYCGGPVPYAPPVLIEYEDDRIVLTVGDADPGICFAVGVPWARTAQISPPKEAFSIVVLDASDNSQAGLLRVYVPVLPVTFADGFEAE